MDLSGGSCRLFKDLTRTKTKSGHWDSELAQWVSLGHWMPIRGLGCFYTSFRAKVAVDIIQ